MATEHKDDKVIDDKVVEKKREPVRRGRRRLIVEKPPRPEDHSVPYQSEHVPPFSITSTRVFSLNESQNETIREYIPCLAMFPSPPLDDEHKPHIIILKHDDTPPIPWPSSSTVCCWNDGHPFSGVPWFAPLEKRGEYYVMEGIFCGFACAARYIEDAKTFDTDTRISMLVDVALRYFKMSFKEMRIAPHRHILDQYSSNGVTIEQYRGETLPILKRLPPFIPATVMFERQKTNDGLWSVRGLRVPTSEVSERIYVEEHADGTVPYPGKPSLYDKFFEQEKDNKDNKDNKDKEKDTRDDKDDKEKDDKEKDNKVDREKVDKEKVIGTYTEDVVMEYVAAAPAPAQKGDSKQSGTMLIQPKEKQRAKTKTVSIERKQPAIGGAFLKTAASS